MNRWMPYLVSCNVLTFRHRGSSIQDRRFATLQRTLFIYLINKYISLLDICLTVHHWYKQYRQPTRCNNNGLLIIPVRSTRFGQNNCPKRVDLTGIINKPLLLHLVGCLYYLYFIIFLRLAKQSQFKQDILFCICEWISESVMAKWREEMWCTCSNSRRSQFTRQFSICLRTMKMKTSVCVLCVTNRYCGVSLMTYFPRPLKKVTKLLRDFPQPTLFLLEPHNVFSSLTAHCSSTNNNYESLSYYLDPRIGGFPQILYENVGIPPSVCNCVSIEFIIFYPFYWHLTLCRSNLKLHCMGRKAAFFQQALKFTYYTRNRSPLQGKKIITIKLKKTEW